MRYRAGQLRAEVHCQKKVDAVDELGNPVPGAGVWTTQFSTSASFIPKHGGEQVLAGRLQGVQAYIVTVRQSDRTRLITPGWRLVDTRDGRSFNIRSLADPDGKRAWLEMLVEHGVAT